MATEEEWNVANSDDERDEALLCIANGVHDIPLQILEYYEAIEKNKVLELQVKEYRKPVPVDSNKDAEVEDVSSENEKKDEIITGDDEKAVDKEEEMRETNQPIEPSEFDEFDELEECQGHIPKRTPKSGRLPKKRVGTLRNVISNLKRFREMDNSINEDQKAESFMDVKEEDKNENVTEETSNT